MAREMLQINQMVIVPGRVRVPSSVHPTTALQIKKKTLPLPETCYIQQTLIDVVIFFLLEVYYSATSHYFMYEIRTFHYIKQLNVNLLTLLPILYHYTATYSALQYMSCSPLCFMTLWKSSFSGLNGNQ